MNPQPIPCKGPQFLQVRVCPLEGPRRHFELRAFPPGEEAVYLNDIPRVLNRRFEGPWRLSADPSLLFCGPSGAFVSYERDLVPI